MGSAWDGVHLIVLSYSVSDSFRFYYGVSPPRDMAPLSGVSVLDVTRLLPGGFATMILSDLGAEVLKVEQPGVGDYMRLTPPVLEGTSLVHDMVNRNKRSIGLDLKSREGKSVLRRLIPKSDVFVEGFRPGAIDRLGFSFGAVRKLNPKIVYCSISGFGQDSKLSKIPGHDLNFEAMSGILSYNTATELPFVQYADFCAGAYAAIGILAGLSRTDRKAIHVDVPIAQSLMSWLILPYSAFLATGIQPRPGHSLLFGSEPYYAIYGTSDGKQIAVAAIEDEFWSNLLRELKQEELKDLRYGDTAHKESVRRKLARVFEGKTRDEWSRLLMDKNTCTTPVLGLVEALRSEWASSRLIEPVPLRRRSRSPVLITPLLFSGTRKQSKRNAPWLGQHTTKILRGLGYPVSEIKSMRETRAIA